MHATTLPDQMAAQIARWERAGDRRAVFLACYMRMTERMLAGVGDGRFHNGPWVERFVHDFAGYYFAALEAYDAGDQRVPPIWREAHELAARPETTIVQCLLLGVNAHINYDLALVLDDLLRDEWAALSPAGRRARYEDYCAVNAVIGETIDAVQDEVVRPQARLMAAVDLACGPLDEWLTARLLRSWRSDVWAQALALVEAPDELARRELRRALAATAAARVRLLREGGAIGARAFGYPLRALRRLRLL